MNPLIHLRQATAILLVALTCFGLSTAVRAVVPAPDGGYPHENTAEGSDALLNLQINTSLGGNTAIGFEALRNDTTGAQNTAVGDSALHHNTNGNFNTAVGLATLAENQTGDENTAIGWGALSANTGNSNTAAGLGALTNNHGGGGNTAVGDVALQSNVSGSFNTATGFRALNDNSTGFFNTAFGYQALQNNTIASFNIAIGVDAGVNLTTGGSNIDIGNFGVAGEERKIRIGTQGTQNGTFIAGISGVAVSGSHVVVNAMGKLGVAASSARFKDEIKPMDKASEAILALKPVTFHYKKEVDPDGIPQFGLVAEQVEKVNPNLIARDADGKPYTVRYEVVNAMLLNEFLKEHKKTDKLEATVASLIAAVKEQAAQIQKVSAQLETSKPALQVAENP